MKVGLVASSSYIEKINMVVKKEFDQINITNIIYDDYKKVPEMLEKIQKKYDVLMFTGMLCYKYALQHIQPETIWEKFPRHGDRLLRALLEVIERGYDIKNISFDTYSKDVLEEIYAEIGFAHDLKIQVINESILDVEYNNRVFEFHRANYRQGKTSCCITALYKVTKMLEKEGIPHIVAVPTYNTIRESFKKAYLKYQAKINQKSQLVVLSICINIPKEYSINDKNEYRYILDKMKVSEQIYFFAQKIQAAVIEPSKDSYLLFSTKEILESETDNLYNIELFENLKNQIFNSISIGIGYGETAIEAKYNANIAMEKAKQKGENILYVIYSGNRIYGPIKYNNTDDSLEINKRFYKIADESQVSLNKIFQIYNIIEREQKKNFTSKELATKCGISIRSMDRIIEKLENAGYIEIVGKNIITQYGRPSRIIKINFN
ncbi:winged helix-turn-helix transcriptional regulator [Fusobacterium ulcerans]|uniref:winged helix-turn-helix transcriptional regulator n=1 Tax=Fusobacterium ulcerans TaxID=861 RepID=UPI0026F01130|nr:winged helix-turn-helix transcriptional regulator [Fusobacterium ulcerans]